MPSFPLAHKFVKTWEGEYSFDPHDRGGETLYGISRLAHPEWWALVDAGNYTTEDIADLAEALYRREYWEPLKADEYPSQRLATVVYQAAVNCGVRRASRWLQAAIREECRRYIAIDGIVGPNTLAALKSCEHADTLADSVLERQEEHYQHQCELDPSQRRFLAGWLNRVKAARAIA